MPEQRLELQRVGTVCIKIDQSCCEVIIQKNDAGLRVQSDQPVDLSEVESDCQKLTLGVIPEACKLKIQLTGHTEIEFAEGIAKQCEVQILYQPPQIVNPYMMPGMAQQIRRDKPVVRIEGTIAEGAKVISALNVHAESVEGNVYVRLGTIQASQVSGELKTHVGNIVVERLETGGKIVIENKGELTLSERVSDTTVSLPKEATSEVDSSVKIKP